MGHLQRAQGDICICDLFHLQGSHSFSLCMAFVHHHSFSTISQTIQRDAKATGVDSTAVSIFFVILIELINTVFVNSTNITTNIETATLSSIVLIAFDPLPPP